MFPGLPCFIVQFVFSWKRKSSNSLGSIIVISGGCEVGRVGGGAHSRFRRSWISSSSIHLARFKCPTASSHSTTLLDQLVVFELAVGFHVLEIELSVL